MADPTQGAGAADPSMQAPDSGAGNPVDASQGYMICINVAADKSITVSVNPAGGDQDASQGSAMAGSDDDSQSVPNIRAACKVVMDIYNNAGQIQDASAEQDQMSSGYGGGN